jgi:hypothetical protein
MATNRDQKRKSDRVSSKSTQSQDERHLRKSADSAGQSAGALPDTPDQRGLEPAQDNTGAPRPFPSAQRRSGPGRKL